MNGGLQAKGQGSEDKGPEESSQVPGFLLKVCPGKTRSCRCHSLGPCHHYLLSLGHRRLGGGWPVVCRPGHGSLLFGGHPQSLQAQQVVIVRETAQ